MSAQTDELVLRVERLEQDLRELNATVSPSILNRSQADLADAMSFRAWMRISAPTFAVMVTGFTLLWNAQQANTAQLLETSRSLGRLDAAVSSLEKTTERFDERLDGIDERLAGLDERLAGIDARLGQIDGTLGTLGASVGRLAAAVEKLEARL